MSISNDFGTCSPVPTPAAASPQKPITKVSSSTQCPEVRYRIRAVEDDGEVLGYLGPAANYLPLQYTGCLNAASPKEDAFVLVSEPNPGASNLSRLLVVVSYRLLFLSTPRVTFRTIGSRKLVRKEMART